MKKRNIIFLLILAIALGTIVTLIIMNFVFGNFFVKYTSHFFNVSDCAYTTVNTGQLPDGVVSSMPADLISIKGCDEAWQCDFLFAETDELRQQGKDQCYYQHATKEKSFDLCNKISNYERQMSCEGIVSSSVYTLTVEGSYVLTNQNIIDDTDNHEIFISYPVMSGSDNTELVNTVNKEIKKHVDMFKTNFELSESDIERDIKNSLTIDYEAKFTSDEILSIYFSVNEYYYGSAHGFTYVVPFNYDLVNNKIIYLSDMFAGTDYLNVLSNYVQNYLLRSDTFDEDWVKLGTVPEINNFDSFTFQKTGLVFYFDPYHIAPYADGIQQAVVPFGVLFNNTDIAQDSVLRLIKTD